MSDEWETLLAVSLIALATSATILLWIKIFSNLFGGG
tara:strand:+ start:597 stop:707 length:111 start_codon:yes stop_codon:yes gene_type:complete